MNRPAELLAELVAGRASASSISLEDLPALAGRLEEVRMALQIRIATAAAPPPAGDESNDDEVLDVRGAAALLNQTDRWVRKHAAELPRVPMPGSRLLRFSRKRLLSALKKWSYSASA